MEKIIEKEITKFFKDFDPKICQGCGSKNATNYFCDECYGNGTMYTIVGEFEIQEK